MKTSPRIRLGLSAVALAVMLSASGTAQAFQRVTADMILTNGNFWTVDDDNPKAEAVAIKDGKFLAVGANDAILAFSGPQTSTIHLGGAFVVPGFNDNHIHFSNAAQFHEFNIMRTSRQEEFVGRVRELVAKLPDGDWITGGLWGAYDQWTEGSAGGERRQPFAPDMRLVDEISKDHPIFINKFDSSEFAANSAALKAAGLDPRNPKADGVEFVRDAQGRLTGLIRGRDVQRLFGRGGRGRGRASYERRVQQTKNALKMIAAAGVTNVSDMSDDTQVRIYQELRAKGELTVRIHYRYRLERWKELADKGIKIGSGDEWIRFGSLKGHIDGIMGTSQARFFEPYTHDSTNRGYWRRLMHSEEDDTKLEPERFLNLMLGADKAGLQITVHAIGDEANNVILNYLDELNRQNGKKDRRFRLVHAQVIGRVDFKRLGELDVVAEVQPFHLSDDMRWMEERIGHERCEGAYAFKSIADSGSILCFGTDWPGTSAAEYPINPMLGLFAAVTRQTVTGDPKEGWFPDERVDIETAIRAYTLNTAYADFEEDIKGSIKVGKLADLAVLSRNLLEIQPPEILETEVLYTIAGGRIVYQQESGGR